MGIITYFAKRFSESLRPLNIRVKIMAPEAFRDCIKQQVKPFITNSDQGAQFPSNDYISFLKNEEIKISMNGRGRAAEMGREVQYENLID